MMKKLRPVVAIGVAALMGLGAMPAGAAESEPTLSPNSLGIWRTDDGQMDYEMTLCGDDLTKLCGKLVALHGGGDTRRNRKYLDTYMLKELKPTGQNEWKGTITLQDNSADGKVRIYPGEKLTLSGCAYIVVCADIKLNPVPGPVAPDQ
jgi:uncharacterized protein (DUF2147 family)